MIAAADLKTVSVVRKSLLGYEDEMAVANLRRWGMEGIGFFKLIARDTSKAP